MALVWSKTQGDVRYEVRSAGATMRLYTNGVLHTQFNSKYLLTGSVWDLLLLGAFCLPREQLRRVLVLGVGGGAVIRQLLALFPEVEITGIERNPVHLSVARRFFGLRDRRVTLHAEDAIAWLAMYDGEPYDLVIDDLFGERDGVPCRAVPADDDWFELLAMHLRAKGVLVMNFADAAEVRRSAWKTRGFPAAISLASPTCENRVVVFPARPLAVRDIVDAVAREPKLDKSRLKYRARRIDMP